MTGTGVEPTLATLLSDPDTGESLRWKTGSADKLEGNLESESGRRYPIRDGIPRFVESADPAQSQTADSFGFKWHQAGSWDSDSMRRSATEWLLKRYGFETVAGMRTYFEGLGRVADLGCGGGFSSSLWMDGWAGELWVGVDISTAIDVARERLGHHPRTGFVQADILHLPFRSGTFDAVFSEGVFHHTPSTEAALAAAVDVLVPGGEILFYVYRRKAPVREFTDDHVRDRISALEPSQAWEALRPLTQLARSLTELGATVEVPEDIPFLEIPAGAYDVQRLLYWYFAKLYWNDALSFEENLHINFDWYHPRYAHRQSEEEVRGWCSRIGLKISRFDIDPSGFTVRATKEGAP